MQGKELPPHPMQPNYSDAQLNAFIDSIQQLPVSKWMDNVTFYPDSFFKNQKKCDWIITSNDFEKLKIACKQGRITSKFASDVFKDRNTNRNKNSNDYMDLSFISFDKDTSDFYNYAISLDFTGTDCDLYFFQSNRCIAKHSVINRYGLELNHYKDIDGKTIIYYTENFQSGSGIWWFNFFFYKYYNNQLIPILDEVENTNLQFPWDYRIRWLKSTVVNTNPLTLKMVYYVQFNDSDMTSKTLINDSTTVTYRWDEASKTLKGNYTNSKLNGEEILSYCLADNDLLFIHAYYKELKAALNNPTKHRAVAVYLSSIKEQYSQSKK